MNLILQSTLNIVLFRQKYTHSCSFQSNQVLYQLYVPGEYLIKKHYYSLPLWEPSTTHLQASYQHLNNRQGETSASQSAQTTAAPTLPTLTNPKAGSQSPSCRTRRTAVAGTSKPAAAGASLA